MMMTNITDEMVRERAYYIWEREGKPQGRETDHWHAAMEELSQEVLIGKFAAPLNGATAAQDPPAAAHANGTAKAPARKAPSRKGRIKAIVAKAKDALDGESSEPPPPPAEKKRKRPAKADTDSGTRSPQRS